VTLAPAAAQARRIGVRVGGTVQGVGFRPYVFKLANELGLGGFVLNDERGVAIEVEGEPSAVDGFLSRLAAEAPPLARVDRVEIEPLAPTGGRSFSIARSAGRGAPRALVSTDTATCDACLAELFDPSDRRFRYPFVNCTNCGPRFTIVTGVPYDRALTTMAGFQMCAACRREYEDPRDRRFHAEPIACPACGPRAWLVDVGGRPAAEGGRDAVEGAVDALAAGLIVAVKGVGGFHLACRADDERAVATLRTRKHREEKPFALMVGELDEAGLLVHLEEAERVLLRAPERPIVLAARRVDAPVAAAVAPASAELGVMLPYSPLHHLLLADVRLPLVMTSGNAADEPIAYEDDDALARLGAIADAFLLHDRPIRTRTDDSVVRAVPRGGLRRPLLLRRSRGHVPASIALPSGGGPDLLACGAELKSTFCLARGATAWVGHHVGDLQSYETLRSFTDGVAHFEELFGVRPEAIVHDLHPDYLSTRYALEREAKEHVGVQHHHAHMAACLAEHGETGLAVGAIYDGTGYGSDGAVWGGELLAGDLEGFERDGHLWPVRMPGGEQAIREPWRMACAWLVEAAGPEPPQPRTLSGRVRPERWRDVAKLARSSLSPATTSAGRLFDAVAALCGIRVVVAYEGQAAIELEAAADRSESGAYPIQFEKGVLDAREAILAVRGDVERGVSAGAVSARFHNGLAAATAGACERRAAAHGSRTVVLSGGVFQNRLLLAHTSSLLERAGLRVLVPERLPPNDGGISFGQAAVARARLAAQGARAS
jgi:hydrogenase maturation protein HypF